MKNHKKITYIFLLSLSMISCQKNDDNETPTELATIISETIIDDAEITYTSLKIKGKVTSNGGTEIVNRGVCWSIQPNPTISNDVIMENTNEFTSLIENLVVNSSYYFRVFVTNSAGTSYGEEQFFSTLSFDDTTWHFTTYYSGTGDFSIISEIDFYGDHTTRFDELDLPLHCPGCFITYGTWSINGNELTYIWEGDDADSSTYTYTGTIAGMTMEGSYTHISAPIGVWTAIAQ